jgi:hypothetical protein
MGVLHFFNIVVNKFVYFNNPFATLSTLENVRSAISNFIIFYDFSFNLFARLIAHTPPIEYPCNTSIFSI